MARPFRLLLATGLSLVALAGPAAAAPDKTPRYARHAEAMRFADGLAERQGLPADWVRQQLGLAVRLAAVQRLMLPAPTPAAKNWAAYRERFVEPVRVAAGVRFWQQHREALARAEARWGVPASLVVGIIGVETLYGQHTGNFRVLDTLATLAFDFPAAHPKAQSRSAFFRAELEEFLLSAHRDGRDPTTARGSYAGASGLPQFMPSSVAKYAVDFDADGRIDLLGSAVDAIGSVAHYLHAFGWKPGQPTRYPVSFDAATLDLPPLLAPDIVPTFSPEALAARGVRLDEAGQRHAGPLALVELFNGEAPPSYVAGTENFYVVTRYNWSSYYALAVIELGEAVARQLNN